MTLDKFICFKTFTSDDSNKEIYIAKNKRLLKLCLSKIMFSNPKNSLNYIFEDNNIIIQMMNDYIFELLGHEIIQYYKAGTKRTLRCLYDDKPDGITKSENREFIQNSINFFLLRQNQEYMDDFEYDLIIEYLQINDKKPEPRKQRSDKDGKHEKQELNKKLIDKYKSLINQFNKNQTKKLYNEIVEFEKIYDTDNDPLRNYIPNSTYEKYSDLVEQYLEIECLDDANIEIEKYLEEQDNYIDKSDKIIGKIDDNRYFSNVNEEDMIYYNKYENKLKSAKEKANNCKEEKNIDKDIDNMNNQIKYMKKYNKYQKKLLEWCKKHPVKWYDEEKHKEHIIKMKTF